MKTLHDFYEQFPTEASCRAYFERIRFQEGDQCPHCNHNEIMRFTNGIRYRCKGCKQDFTIKTGTIFGDSKVTLKKWFLAIYLLTTHKKGISSIQLAKFVGVTQKTAWFMDHRIRESLKQGTHILFGTVEADEMYVGGLEKNKHYNKKTKHKNMNLARACPGKVPVLGLLVRGGEARTKVVDQATLFELQSHVLQNVAQGSTVYTDEHLGYSKLNRYYTHGTTEHGAKKYVRGDIHSNGMESFWAIFKRGFKGSYHVMSKKHLQRYMDEFTYRFNNRHLSFGDIFTKTLQNTAIYPTINYKTLTYEETQEA